MSMMYRPIKRSLNDVHASNSLCINQPAHFIASIIIIFYQKANILVAVRIYNNTINTYLENLYLPEKYIIIISLLLSTYMRILRFWVWDAYANANDLLACEWKTHDNGISSERTQFHRPTQTHTHTHAHVHMVRWQMQQRQIESITMLIHLLH